MTGTLYGVTLAAALGCGLVAGVLFAFSAFVMKALGRLPAKQGIASMQSINAAAPTPAFMVALLETALACATLIVSSLFAWDEPFAVYLLLGGGLYMFGAIFLTGVYHVPQNEALSKVEPDAAEARDHWAGYLSRWTKWNHVRVAASFAAAAMFTVALSVG